MTEIDGRNPFRVGNRDSSWLRWLYLAYAVPALLLFAVIMAPVQVADEFSHSLRADQISRGTLLSRFGGVVDGGLAATGRLFEHLYFHPEEKVTTGVAAEAGGMDWSLPAIDYNFQNTAQYGPLLYLPTAVGIALGRAADLSVMQTLLLARLCNGLVAVVIGFAALSFCRRSRAVTFTVLLLPMTLSQFGSASQDAPIIALTILAAAIVSRAIDERRLATDWEFLAFMLIVVVTTTARPSQFALLALLPAMGGWRHAALGRKAVTAAIAIVLIAIWLVVLRGLMPPVPPNLSVERQLAHMITEPLSLPLALAATIARDWGVLIGSTIGRFGWFDTPMPAWFYVAAVLALCCALLTPGNRPPNVRPAFWAVVTMLGMVTAIAVALYMSWTPVANPTIDGLQGRYFLPFLPLLGWLVPAYGPRLTSALRPLWLVVLTFPLLSLIVAPAVLVERYYGHWPAMGRVLWALYLR